MPPNSTLIPNQGTSYSIADEEKKRARRIIVEDGVTSLAFSASAESQTQRKVIPSRSWTGSSWALLLIKQPQFADMCPWYKLTGLYLVKLLKHQGQLAEKCRWKNVIPSCQTEIAALLPHLTRFCIWEKISVRKLFRDYKVNLSQYKLEYISTLENWHEMMEAFYSGRSGNYKGIFADGVEDAATYMIFKAMDKANAKLFLKCLFDGERWDFLEELCDISPEELTHVPGKNKMPFYIALNAPDKIFYKFFQSCDQNLRDKAGNSVLFPALVHDLLNNQLNRFEFLCQKGFDPDEKNFAGFSCNDMIKHYSKKG